MSKIYRFLWVWLEIIVIITFIILIMLHWENMSVIKRCYALLVTALNVVMLLIMSYDFIVK